MVTPFTLADSTKGDARAVYEIVKNFWQTDADADSILPLYFILFCEYYETADQWDADTVQLMLAAFKASLSTKHYHYLFTWYSLGWKHADNVDFEKYFISQCTPNKSFFRVMTDIWTEAGGIFGNHSNLNTFYGRVFSLPPLLTAIIKPNRQNTLPPPVLVTKLPAEWA